MSYCKYCGSEMPDGARFCTNCGAELEAQTTASTGGYEPYSAQQNIQPPYQQPAQSETAYQPYGAQQPPYQPYGTQQPPYAPQPQQPNTQGYYQQAPEQADAYYLASKAKSNGIVAIVFAFLIPLVSWIVGGMGISKANKALDYATITNDQQLIDNAKKAKTLAAIGIGISLAMTLLNVFVMIGQQ